MKYKVGDKFRMVDGGIASVEGARCDVYKVIEGDGVNYVTSAYITRQIISEITDEVIDRFKKEKIAWHFQSEQDYYKILDILKTKEIKFVGEDKPQKYFYNYEEFCIRFDYEFKRLYYAGVDFYVSEGYEIIEIMNPVYVPPKVKTIKQEVFNMIYNDDVRLESGIVIPIYKGIDCELLYQHYINVQDLGKTNINLWNKIQRFKKENDTLLKKLQEYIEIYELLKYNISNFEKK